MKFYDALELAARAAGMSLNQVSRNAGHADAYVSSGRSRGSVPKVDNAAKLLDACGYALAAVPKEDLPEGAIVIGGEDDPLFQVH